ncbi:hypothetical protein Tco_0773444 [Tanacetum coccineum]|uniref:Uncharacterized protein n=1 Tax=Tanacetum coccineum TaxID=301880 RepID=A0ABQ4ZKR9_9ASTR
MLGCLLVKRISRIGQVEVFDEREETGEDPSEFSSLNQCPILAADTNRFCSAESARDDSQPALCEPFERLFLMSSEEMTCLQGHFAKRLASAINFAIRVDRVFANLLSSLKLARLRLLLIFSGGLPPGGECKNTMEDLGKRVRSPQLKISVLRFCRMTAVSILRTDVRVDILGRLLGLFSPAAELRKYLVAP